MSKEPSVSNVCVPRPRWPACVFCLAGASSDGTLQPEVSSVFSSSVSRAMTALNQKASSQR